MRLKYDHSSVDIGYQLYTYVLTCILLKYKCTKNVCPPPPSQKRSYGLVAKYIGGRKRADDTHVKYYTLY